MSVGSRRAFDTEGPDVRERQAGMLTRSYDSSQ